MKRLERFLVNTVILVLTSLFIRTISMFFDIYIANKVGSQAIGLFGLIMSVYFFAMTIANSGIGLASTRIVAEELAVNCQSGAKIAIKKCLSYSLFFGIVAGLLLFILGPFICQKLLHGKIQASVLYIIAISLPFSSMGTSLNGYFIGVKRISKNSFYDIFNTLLKICTTLILLNFFPPTTMEAACFALIIANTISEIVSFFYLYLLYFFDRKKLQDSRMSGTNYLKRVLNISIPVAITSYIRSGLSTIKQLLIPLRLEKYGMSCENALSSYGIINGMVMPLLLFPGLIVNSVSSLLIPEFARYNTKHDFKRMNEVINSTFSLTIIFSCAVIGVYLCFNTELAQYTYKNIQIANYLLLLCPLLLFMYLDHIIDSILKGIDKQVGVMYCNIIDLFISIFLLYTLLPIYGMAGYLLVLCISEIFNFSISLYQLYRATHFSFDCSKRSYFATNYSYHYCFDYE